MSIKIVSDGTSLGTNVLTEDGRRIDKVKSVDWSVGPHGIAIATIRIAQPDMEVDGISLVRRIRHKLEFLFPLTFFLGTVFGIVSTKSTNAILIVVSGVLCLLWAVYSAYRIDQKLKLLEGNKDAI